MIKILSSSRCLKEKIYIYDIIFSRFLGLDYQYEIKEENLEFDECILPNDKVLKVNSIFFYQADSNWGDVNTLPDLNQPDFSFSELPFDLNIRHSSIPVLFGLPKINFIPKLVHCHIDIFGTMFFMLSRYEETVIKKRDSRDRFSSNQSIAFQKEFLLRPIVNEYLELFWSLMKSLDPSLERIKREYKFTLTCDVDWPFNPNNKNILDFLKSSVKAIIRNKDVNKFYKIIKEFYKSNFFGWKYDSHNTFNTLMGLAEKVNSQMIFYFICDHSHGKIDGNYTMENKNIRKLLKEIHSRGHLIGLHGSYNTYLNQSQMKKEFDILNATLNDLKISQKLLGARQHFLRYQSSRTAEIMNDIGIDFDSTLSYADHAGFRTGTCFEFPLYNLDKREGMKIIESPLIAMEASVISDKYMSLGYSDSALKVFKDLIEECKFYNGDFVLLWHNSFFQTKNDLNFLKEIC